jgi:hypothetical protein
MEMLASDHFIALTSVPGWRQVADARVDIGSVPGSRRFGSNPDSSQATEQANARFKNSSG